MWKVYKEKECKKCTKTKQCKNIWLIKKRINENTARKVNYGRFKEELFQKKMFEVWNKKYAK